MFILHGNPSDEKCKKRARFNETVFFFAPNARVNLIDICSRLENT